MYITIVSVGLGIFLLFRVLVFLNKVMPFPKRFKQLSASILPAAELIVWFGFVVWFIRLFYKAYDYTALIVIGVVAVLLMVPIWFLIKDFIFGLILKLQRKLLVDTMIEIEEIKGVVLEAGHLSFDIRTPDGKIDTIPYNKVISKVISKQGTNINLDNKLISFRFKAGEDKNIMLSRLKSSLVNAPWVAASQEPIIKEVQLLNGEYQVDVVVYFLKKEHADRIKDYVVSMMGEKRREIAME
jgi:hypothetical protein